MTEPTPFLNPIQRAAEDPFSKPLWVVNDKGELGVLVGGHVYFMYKGESFEYKDERIKIRPVGKREFDEVVQIPITEEFQQQEWFDHEPPAGEPMTLNLQQKAETFGKPTTVLRFVQGCWYIDERKDITKYPHWCELPALIPAWRKDKARECIAAIKTYVNHPTVDQALDQLKELVEHVV